jgi:hypothetical protein
LQFGRRARINLRGRRRAAARADVFPFGVTAHEAEPAERQLALFPRQGRLSVANRDTGGCVKIGVTGRAAAAQHGERIRQGLPGQQAEAHHKAAERKAAEDQHQGVAQHSQGLRENSIPLFRVGVIHRWFSLVFGCRPPLRVGPGTGRAGSPVFFPSLQQTESAAESLHRRKKNVGLKATGYSFHNHPAGTKASSFFDLLHLFPFPQPPPAPISFDFPNDCARPRVTTDSDRIPKKPEPVA